MRRKRRESAWKQARRAPAEPITQRICFSPGGSSAVQSSNGGVSTAGASCDTTGSASSPRWMRAYLQGIFGNKRLIASVALVSSFWDSYESMGNTTHEDVKTNQRPSIFALLVSSMFFILLPESFSLLSLVECEIRPNWPPAWDVFATQFPGFNLRRILELAGTQEVGGNSRLWKRCERGGHSNRGWRGFGCRAMRRNADVGACKPVQTAVS